MLPEFFFLHYITLKNIEKKLKIYFVKKVYIKTNRA